MAIAGAQQYITQTLLSWEGVASGQAAPHHILPETGWISLYLHQQEDVSTAILLLQRSYDIARSQRQSRKPPTMPSPARD